MLLDFRKPKCVVVKTIKSASGKYELFFGHHYHKGHLCYDVGSVNQLTGEIITRHYRSKTGAEKAEALRVYHEYEKELTRKPAVEESDDNDPRVGDAFRRLLH